MAFEALDILQLVMLITWTVLSDTPTNQKNTLFGQFFTSDAVFREIAATISIAFAPGLFDVLQSAAPPTIKFFKTLPTDATKRWGVYLLVLEKANCRPKIYVGSGTESQYGVSNRFAKYDLKNALPRYIQEALDDGYTIVHKGLLCWTAIPPASQVPKIRLLFFLLEATFAYIFWAMRTIKRDYGMAHICQWDRATLEYDGSCSHCSLFDGILGDFDLSEEQLEAVAAEKKEKNAAAKSAWSTNNHFTQMATNHDEYLEKNAAWKASGRAKDGGEYHRQNARDNAAKHHEAKTHHCVLCKRTFPTAHMLRRHNKTKPHLNKAKDLASKPYRCDICAMAFDHRGHFNVHLKGARHLKKAAAESSSKLD
jgi:hypothetical protein